MDLFDLRDAQEQAREAERRGRDVTRKTKKGLEIEEDAEEEQE